MNKTIKITLLTATAILSIGGGVALRTTIESMRIAMQMPAPSPLEILPSSSTRVLNPIPAVSVEASNAAATYREILAWIESLNATTRSMLADALTISADSYTASGELEKNYSTYLACRTYILSSAIKRITAADIATLTTKKLAFDAILGAQAVSENRVSEQLLRGLTDAYIQVELIGTLGAPTVLSADNQIRSTNPELPYQSSRAACFSIPGAEKYR